MKVSLCTQQEYETLGDALLTHRKEDIVCGKEQDFSDLGSYVCHYFEPEI